MRVVANSVLSNTFSDADDEPPAVSCARCGSASCGGCDGKPKAAELVSTLPWESRSGSWCQRLWYTALASSTQPLRVFGQLPDGRLLPALTFALVAELVAIGSVGSAAALVSWAMAPELFARLLATPSMLAVAAGALLIMSVTMVGLHALWGICIELGAGTTGSSARFRHGVRFGLYACGWDLLTSPAGVLQGLSSRGLIRAWAPITQAIAVPRAAVRAYVEQCRKLDPRAQRRGSQLTVWVLGAAGVVTAVALLTALFLLLTFVGPPL
ncbi:MAG TPA: hypothetical protein VER33_14020 [Polyangiaceae bacterium]|nr:hypothetical protein [Polyangiaceae bacterium]